MRARIAVACADFGRRANIANLSLSSAVRSSGYRIDYSAKF